jgi:hypothetical protein
MDRGSFGSLRTSDVSVSRKFLRFFTSEIRSLTRENGCYDELILGRMMTKEEVHRLSNGKEVGLRIRRVMIMMWSPLNVSFLSLTEL